MIRLRILVSALVLFALPRAGLAQDTLVHIQRLGPRVLRTAFFRLDTPQNVRIEAVGARPVGRGALRRFLEHGILQGKEARTWDAGVWPGNAWILDAKSRRVVWELRTSAVTTSDDGLPEFQGVARLPAGTYEAHYAALFPVSHQWNDKDDWRVYSEDSPRSNDALHGPYLDDGRYRRFQLLIRGTGRAVTRDAARDSFVSAAFISLDAGRQPARAGFELDRPVRVQLTVAGRRDARARASILEADSRRIVWSSEDRTGEPAGGAARNRLIRESVQLGAGKYVAVYRSPSVAAGRGAWTETPPYDPLSPGFTVRINDAADRRAARTFEYQPIPADAFVSLAGLGDDELRWQRFAITRPVDIRIFAVGEGPGSRMVDYGWIVDQAGKAVWSMSRDATEPAGGAGKNRLASAVVRLPAGRYTAYFTTDGSHSFDDGWNDDEPLDGPYWGMTIGLADPRKDASAVRALTDTAQDPGVLARITQVGDNRDESAQFTLSTRQRIRIHAVGEGTSAMVDYASLYDASGGEVWRMQLEETENAGGADKNRQVSQALTLDAGTYSVRFRTDGSHSWDDWNADLPDDPRAWGVTVYRAVP